MPSRQGPEAGRGLSGRVCIFGDSHLGAAKRALDAGLIDTRGREVTFWGADGPSFRALRWKRGQIVPDAGVRSLVGRISGGLERLGPGDFDKFIFYGARLRAHEFFKAVLEHEARPEGHLSQAQMQALVAHWSESTRAWRFARLFAAAGADVVFVPTAFPSEGVLDKQVERARFAVSSTKAARARIWKVLEGAAGTQGFTLARQPDATVTRATMTRAEFAVPGAAESRDWVHKSPQYAALILEPLFAERQAGAIAAE